MRKTKFLRTLSVTAAALCAALVMVYCGSPTGGDDDDKPKETLALKSLSLVCDGQSLNGFSFDPKTGYYSLELEKETGGKSLTVTAEADSSGVAIAITVGGSRIDNGGTAVLPKTGEGAKQIIVSLSKANANPAEYKVDLKPQQSSSTVDCALGSVYIGYTETSGTLMTGAVEGLTGTAKSTDRTKTSAVVIAQAASSEAAIELSYGGKTENGSGGIARLDSIRLPDVDGSEKLEIQITNGAASMTYTIMVKGFTQNEVEWHIKVSYSGGEGMQIRGVMAMNRAGDLESAQTTDADTRQSWTLRVGNLYKPAFFTVNLRKQTGMDTSDPENPKPVYEYKQSRAFALPEGINAAADTSPDNPIALTVTDNDVGLLITNADDFYNWLNTAHGDTSFALGSDIDLSKRTNKDAEWVGPEYAGKFYGNGFTIKNLEIVKTNGSVGLFDKLTGTAVIENFTLEARTKNAYAARDGASWFGGVVGAIKDASADVAIRNVTVKGKLEIGPSPTGNFYFLGGGLVGEINSLSKLTIENCVSELSIDGQGGNNWGFFGIGGLIGRIGPQSTSASAVEILIKNSYATGDLYASNTKNNGNTFAGGLIGDITKSIGKPVSVTLENCYASGKVTVIANNNAGAAYCGSGGLIGIVHHDGGSNALTVTITNCAAVNEQALFVSNANEYKRSNGRFAGYIPNTNLAVSMNGNIARSGMLIGVPPDGAPDDAEDTVDSTSSTAAVGFRGAGKTLTELTTESTWTDGLGWSTSVWDFSGLKSNPPVWPTFNKAKYE